MIQSIEAEQGEYEGKTPLLLISDLSLHDNTDPEEDGGLFDFSLPMPLLPDEDSLFEFFRDLGERRAEFPITVLLRRERSREDSASFRLPIRSLFRAAVYGEFSLLIGGIVTEEDRTSALQEIHQVFCELESDGREFNGYIPKGILIDTPLALNKLQIGDGVDFFCLEITKLLRLLTGMTPKELCADPSLLSNIMEEIVPFYERADRESIKKAAWITEPMIHPAVLSRLSQWNANELFLPRKSIEEARQIFLNRSKTRVEEIPSTRL